MKLLSVLCILCVLCVSQLRAADQITEATITVTNFSGINTNGTCTLTINGDIRTATNIISANPAIYFYGTNSMLHGKTNLYNHISLYPFGAGASRQILINIGTNSFKLRSQVNQALAGSVAGLWGTISFSTITITNFTGVTVPLEYYSAPEATNVAYELTRFFAKASNAVPATAQGLSNHLNQFEQQQASNKVFFASTNRGGALENIQKVSGTNVALTNVVIQWVGINGVTNLQGTNVLATNVTLRHYQLIDGRPEGTNAGITNGYTVGLTNINSVSSNHVNYGAALRSEGPGGNSLQLGSNAMAAAALTLALGNDAKASNQNTVVVGIAAKGTNNGVTVLGTLTTVGGIAGIGIGQNKLVLQEGAIGIGANVNGYASFGVGYANTVDGSNSAAILGTVTSDFALAFGPLSVASALYSLSIGAWAQAIHSNSAAIGPMDSAGTPVTTSRTNQIALGTAKQSVYVPGFFSAESYSNITAQIGSTNRFPAGSDLSFGRSTVATIANGHNTINVGTNLYIDLTGSPSAAWTWGGITGGNRDGKLLKVRNSTGWPTDIIHNSGTEPTAALRITTPTSTNVTLNASGWAEFLYDSTASRWMLADVFNTATPAASATNALASLSTNGVQVTAAWTNLNLVHSPNLVRTTNASGNVSIELRADGKLFKLGTAVTVTNTTSPTSLLTNGTDGPQIIKANTLTTNMTIRVKARGFMTSVSATTTEIGMRMNNATLIATNLAALATTLVNDSFEIECDIDIRAIGASGSVLAVGTFWFPTSSGSPVAMSPRRMWNGLLSTPVTIDTTVDQVVDLYVDPGAITHGFTLTQCYVELVQ